MNPLTPGIEKAPTSNDYRAVALVTIITPFLAFLLAVILLWRRAVGPLDLGLCLAMYAVTLLGITVGFHRLFTHRSFRCPMPIRAILCIAGSMAAQGSVFFWVASHRLHHQCSDDAGDPHSPHLAGGDGFGLLRGWWHAHVGWMYSVVPKNYFRLIPDLLRDRMIVRVNRFYLVFVFLGLILPGAVGAGISGKAEGFWTGLLWGGFVRIFLVHHVTWSINSVCHLFGDSPFVTNDQSRNNIACAIFGFGEGWHNNHHAFPSSARHGFYWWQIDFGFVIIRLMEVLGLADEVRQPSSEQVISRQRSCALIAESKAGETYDRRNS